MVESLIKSKRIVVRADQKIDFEYSARSFGWFMLAPNQWLEGRMGFQRIDRLTNGKIIQWTVCCSQSDPQHEFNLDIEYSGCLSKAEVGEIVRNFRWAFRLDEDLSEFYSICKAKGGYWKSMAQGRGRLLRSPTVFEDLVKTICTTNTTWARTVKMVEKLAQKLGDRFSISGMRAFPTYYSIVEKGNAFLESEVGLGYRGKYIFKLAQRIAEGGISPEDFKDPSVEDKVLKQLLLSIEGVGDYSASTMMMLLGRYGELAIDTEMVKHVGNKYYRGVRPSIDEIDKIYRDWGRWKYLAYWFDQPAQGAVPKNSVLGLHVKF